MCKKLIYLISFVLVLGLAGNASAGNIAWNPFPADGAVCVDLDVVLSWSPGDCATSHDVYFGGNEADVTNATVISPEFKGNQTALTYPLTGLLECTTYYWRIDEVCEETIVAVPPNPAHLVVHYEFEGNANDSSSNGFNGTENGDPTYVPGKIVQAISLDGDGDYVDLGNPAALNFGTGNWTVSVWIKTTNSDKGVPFANGGDGTGGIRYALGVGESQNDKITLSVDDDATKVQAHSSTSVTDDEWYCVVGVRDGDTLRVYVDRELEATAGLPAGYDLSGTVQHNALIGAIWNHDGGISPYIEKYYTGLIDDLRVYDYALSYEEVLYVCGCEDLIWTETYKGEVWSFTTVDCPCVDPPEGLIAWWPLDETAPSTARDIAGSHDGYHLSSPGFATGMVGGAYRFDWNNQGIVRVANDPFVEIGEGDFTIDAWIFPETLGWWCLNYPDYSPCEERPIIDNRWGMAEAKGVEFFVQNATAGSTACRVLPGHLGLHMNTDFYNTTRFLSSTTPVVADEWQHVAVTVSRTGGTRIGTFYHNGVAVPGTFEPILGQLFHGVQRRPRLDIGHGTPSFSGGSAYTNRYFSGLLDEVEIFNRALDAGEIWEIYMVCSSGKCKPSLDFGDAPERGGWNYPTTLANNGARHIIDTNVHLGDYIDAENDGGPPMWGSISFALGDDMFGGPDDEDGVKFVTPLIPGTQRATIEVSASVAGYLDVWIDFDQSGDWNYGDEQIFVAKPLPAGLNKLVFAVPETAKSSRTCARFRFTTVAGGLPYDGLAQDGEVEDYGVIIQKGPGPSTKGSYAKWSQRPVEYDVNELIFDGWDERSDYNRPPVPIVADDWEWKDDRPVTDFHWWGSFLGWKGAEPPTVVPKAFHIGIWTDVPYPHPNNPNTFSHPGELIWENYCENYVWNFVGFDRDPRYGDINDTCFQFNQLLSQDEWFYGEPSEDPNSPTIYWLSIAAIYDDVVGVYRVVDDFESYDFTNNLIYETWLDGTYNGTGSWIDLGTTPDRVHGGNQSMVFIYDNNSSPYYSEGAFTPVEMNWTARDAKVLGLWFKGETYNDAEQMYVALEDTHYNVGVVKHPAPDAAQTQDWQLWCIDLQEFANAGVNLTNVQKVCIGFGDRYAPVAGGWGVVYFDDIRLYEQCLSEPSFPWGWKTRPHYYNDDAVRIATLDGGEWPPVISSIWGSGEPIEYPQSTSWDLSFEVTTNTPAYKDDPILGDLNMDEIVNFRDLAIMADRWLEEKIWP